MSPIKFFFRPFYRCLMLWLITTYQMVSGILFNSRICFAKELEFCMEQPLLQPYLWMLKVVNLWMNSNLTVITCGMIDPQTHRPLNSAPVPAPSPGNNNNNKRNNNTSTNTKTDCSNKFEMNVQSNRPVMQLVPEFILSTGRSIGTDKNHNYHSPSSAEDSSNNTSGSGVTTEEAHQELNLELSIGLPQQPRIINQKPAAGGSYQFFGANTNNNPSTGAAQTGAACLCYNLGFQNSKLACSCSSNPMPMSTIITADNNLHRFYRPPLDSWNCELRKYS